MHLPWLERMHRQQLSCRKRVPPEVFPELTSLPAAQRARPQPGLRTPMGTSPMEHALSLTMVTGAPGCKRCDRSDPCLGRHLQHNAGGYILPPAAWQCRKRGVLACLMWQVSPPGIHDVAARQTASLSNLLQPQVLLQAASNAQ